MIIFRTLSEEKFPMSKSLPQRDLNATISAISGVDKKTVTAVLKALSLTIHSEVANGGGITLPGTLKVMCRDRPARVVRNPATGEMISKGADRRVTATILKSLKEAAAKET